MCVVQEGLATAKKTETDTNNKKSKGFMAWVSEKTEEISVSLGSGANVEKTPEDLEFDELYEYIDGFEQRMTVSESWREGGGEGSS